MSPCTQIPDIWDDAICVRLKGENAAAHPGVVGTIVAAPAGVGSPGIDPTDRIVAGIGVEIYYASP